MNSIIRKIKRLVAMAGAGTARFQYRGVVVWQFGVICDQQALAHAIDAAIDDPRTPNARQADARAAAALCRVHLRATNADDDAPMLAAWRYGVTGDVGLVTVGAMDDAGESVRRGLLALIRRRLDLPQVVDHASSAVA